MATSRTGTAKWKNLRARALHKAKHSGQTHCPEPNCGVPLDYQVGRTPVSAEVDHIVPHSKGGQDHIDNVRVICRKCNQSLGGKTGNPRKPLPPLRTSRKW